MKRWILVLAALVVVTVAWLAPGPTRAQDATPAYEATIAAYQTQVADLEGKVDKLQTSVAKRDAKIDEQRARIAELKTPQPTPSPTAPPHLASFSGTGPTLTKAFSVAAGTYRVDATVRSRDTFEPFFVDVVGPGGFRESVFIVAVEQVGEWTGSVSFTAPADGDYYFEVNCTSPWTLTVDPL